eukprot:SAG22_NODE_1445_length_4406_cov_7.808684_5_plen_214_part_00
MSYGRRSLLMDSRTWLRMISQCPARTFWDGMWPQSGPKDPRWAVARAGENDCDAAAVAADIICPHCNRNISRSDDYQMPDSHQNRAAFQQPDEFEGSSDESRTPPSYSCPPARRRPGEPGTTRARWWALVGISSEAGRPTSLQHFCADGLIDLPNGSARLPRRASTCQQRATTGVGVKFIFYATPRIVPLCMSESQYRSARRRARADPGAQRL